MTSGNTAPLEQQQKSSSNLLAIFIAVSFIIANGMALFIHPLLNLFQNEAFLILDGLGFALTIVFGAINLENTFTTNDAWKSVIGWLVVVYNILFAALFVSAGA